MKHYFIDGTYYVPGNKAHEEIAAFAAEFNHVVMDEERLKAFVQEMKAKGDEVNAKHKRCKDLHVRHFAYKHISESQSLSVEGTFSLNIQLIKRFETINQ